MFNTQYYTKHYALCYKSRVAGGKISSRLTFNYNGGQNKMNEQNPTQEEQEEIQENPLIEPFEFNMNDVFEPFEFDWSLW